MCFKIVEAGDEHLPDTYVQGPGFLSKEINHWKEAWWSTLVPPVSLEPEAKDYEFTTNQDQSQPAWSEPALKKKVERLEIPINGEVFANEALGLTPNMKKKVKMK